MLENLSYKLTITQKGEGADLNFKNVIECNDHANALEHLARCYRDLNRNERANAIIRAKHWRKDPYNEKRDCFIIWYDVHSDHSVITIYEWEFSGAL